MARPERKTVDYFPHYIGEGKKIFYIEQKYGNDGYATWFKILESLATTENHFLNLNKEMDLMFLSAKCRVDKEVLKTMLDDLSLLGEIDGFLWANNIVFSHRFIESIQDAYGRRNNNCITYEGLCKQLEGLCTTITRLAYDKKNGNTQSKVEESKGKETKEELFNTFWELYDHKKGKDGATRSWMKLSINDMNEAIKAVPLYVQSTPDKQYRKHPQTYLNGKHWKDEIEATKTVDDFDMYAEPEDPKERYIWNEERKKRLLKGF